MDKTEKNTRQNKAEQLGRAWRFGSIVSIFTTTTSSSASSRCHRFVPPPPPSPPPPCCVPGVVMVSYDSPPFVCLCVAASLSCTPLISATLGGREGSHNNKTAMNYAHMYLQKGSGLWLNSKASPLSQQKLWNCGFSTGNHKIHRVGVLVPL